MKNFEKYKTADERAYAFMNFCNGNSPCGKCQLNNVAATRPGCAYVWLDLDAGEEKSIDCPFCGSPTRPNCGHLMMDSIRYWVDCTNPACMYRSGHYLNAADAVSAHNRICRAGEAANKESEVK